MSNTNSSNMAQGSHQNKPNSGFIRCVMKNDRIVPEEFPDKDGWIRAKVYRDQQLIVSNFMMYRSGTKATIYNFLSDTKIWIADYTCDIQAKVILINGGRTTLQDAVMDFVIERCDDVIKLFEEIAPNLKVVELDDVNIRTFSKSGSIETPKRKWTKPRKPVSSDGNASTTNGFMSLSAFEDRYRLVKGHMQSGKTAFMISAAIWFIMQGKHSLIVTRNSSDDCIQLRDRVEKYAKALDESLKQQFGKSGMFPIVALDADLCAKDLNGMPKIMVAIGHETQLNKIGDLLAASPTLHKSFVMFIDEVDFVDSSGTQVKEALDTRIRPHAFCVFGVSGSVLDTAMSEDIERGNVVILKRPEYHKGHENFRAVHLVKPNMLTTRTGDNIFDNDANLRTYLDEFATKEHGDEYFVELYNQKLPIDSLIRASLAIDPNRRLLADVATQYGGVITPMLSTGGGNVWIHLFGYEGSIILADGTRGKITPLTTKKDGQLPGRYYLFKNTSVGHVKQWLYENGGVDKYSRILTIAGNTARRSVSFGAANFDWCKQNNKLWWHLTEMYLCASKDMDQPELLQTSARLSGVYKDSVPLRLFATSAVHSDIIKAYWLQEELIERALKKQNSMRLSESMQNLPIYSGKVCSRPLTKKAEYTLNKVGKDEDSNDGGWDADKIYVRTVRETGERIEDDDILDIGEEEQAEDDEVTISIDPAEFKRLTEKMFPKWSKANSKIANFMHKLGAFDICTNADIRDAGLFISNLTKERKGSQTSNGAILEEVQGGFRLHPCLRTAYQKFF